MYNEKPNLEKMNKQPVGPARIEPDRKWYGNVRTIDQKNLEKFRVEMASHSADPYQILIKSKKLPYSLIKEGSGDGKKPKINTHKMEQKLNSAEILKNLTRNMRERFIDYVEPVATLCLDKLMLDRY